MGTPPRRHCYQWSLVSAARLGGLRPSAALIFYWLNPPAALSLLAASARWEGEGGAGGGAGFVAEAAAAEVGAGAGCGVGAGQKQQLEVEEQQQQQLEAPAADNSISWMDSFPVCLQSGDTHFLTSVSPLPSTTPNDFSLVRCCSGNKGQSDTIKQSMRASCCIITGVF